MNGRSKRVLRILFDALRSHPRELVRLGGWSVVEILPTLLSGYSIARAVDDGFLVGRPGVGVAWLGVLGVAICAGAYGTGHIYRRLTNIVEPFRDELVHHVVRGSLQRCTHGERADTGAVSRLTHQVEIVRDNFAGLIIIARQFLFSVAGALIGLATLKPIMLALVVPPLVLGLVLFFRSLGSMVFRQRDYVLADERVAESTSTVTEGLRDITAFGAEEHMSNEVGRHIDAHARAESALARMTAVRTLSLALGGWLPVVLVLVTGPWLLSNGATAGVIMGALTYLVQGLKPALQALIQGLGGGGLKLLVTLDRLAEAGDTEYADEDRRSPMPSGHRIELRGVRFGFGRHAEPVIDDLDLDIPEGEHLAIVGPSGIGKSTLANLLAGTLTPQQGSVHIGGYSVAELDTVTRSRMRALIPQQAYVFDGTLGDNLRYLNPGATEPEMDLATSTIGMEQLVARLGGYGARIEPGALSAGERQSISLARTYLSSAPVIVLDEGTCYLDPVAEVRVENAFANRAGTLIVIAHRMSSALRARRVLLVDSHQVLLGTHKELFEQSSLYRTLVGHWEGVTTESAHDQLAIPSPAPSVDSLRAEA